MEIAIYSFNVFATFLLFIVMFSLTDASEEPNP